MRQSNATRTWLAAGLLVVIVGGCAKKSAPPVVRITGQDPAPPAALPLQGRLLVRVAYEAKDKIRFHAVGYRGGERFLGTTNPGPFYGPGSGEALVWVGYPKEFEIDEVRVIVSDEKWRPLTEVSAPAAVRWASTASAPVPSEWAGPLEADFTRRLKAHMQQPKP